MEYKNKYEKALERAKSFYYNEQTRVGLTPIDLEYIFPELKEPNTGDEKIKKALIDTIKSWGAVMESPYMLGMSVKDILAWLERQGKCNPYSGTSFEYNGHTWGMCARDYGVDILIDGKLTSHVSLEQGSYEFSGKITSRKSKGTLKKLVDGIEKIQPKFKVGDWVVFNNRHDSIYRVEEIENYQYIFRHILGGSLLLSFSSEHLIRLWSLDDAKDGDVLAVEPVGDYKFPFVVIYKNRGLDFFSSYCFIGLDGKFYEGDTGHVLDEIHPATKEEREILFSKMKEAGWSWNVTTKELSQSQVTNKGWSEEDEKRLKRAIHIFEDNLEKFENTSINDEIDESLISWLKTLKNRVQSKQNSCEKEQDNITSMMEAHCVN